MFSISILALCRFVGDKLLVFPKFVSLQSQAVVDKILSTLSSYINSSSFLGHLYKCTGRNIALPSFSIGISKMLKFLYHRFLLT